MKTAIKLSIYILLCWLAVGCSSEYAWDQEERVEVMFGMDNIIETRTDNVGEEWRQGDKIGIFMLEHNQGSPVEIESNRQYQADSQNSSTSFSPLAGPLYYPPNNTEVDFVCYYPYQSSINGLSLRWNTAVDKTNLMYSTNAKKKNKNSGLVTLDFEQALSKLIFDVQAGTGVTDEEIKRAPNMLSVSSLYLQGTFNLATGMWSDVEELGEMEPNDTTKEMYVIPQLVNNTQLNVRLGQKNVFVYRFPLGTEFEKNKAYLYKITVNKTGLKVGLSDISDWITGNRPEEKPTDRIKYKVGDYYPWPDDPSTAIGMVFEITNPDPDGYGYKGKVVDLQIQNVYLSWGRIGVDEDNHGVAGIRNQADGETGTKNLITTHKDEQDFSTVYAVFNWLYQTKNQGDINGRWYLPSVEELETIANIHSLWQQKAVNAGYTQPGSTYYISSTEEDPNQYFQFLLSEEQRRSTSKEEYVPGVSAVAITKF